MIIVVLVVVLHESYGRPSESIAWTSWKAQHGRRYSTKEEELVRWKTWVKNNRLVDENNRAYDEGRRSFKMAMNEYADQVRYASNESIYSRSGHVPDGNTVTYYFW